MLISQNREAKREAVVVLVAWTDEVNNVSRLLYMITSLLSMAEARTFIPDEIRAVWHFVVVANH